MLSIVFPTTADILIIVGTSLQVYPAATLIHYTKEECTVYIVDPNTIPKLDSHIHLRMNASDGLSELKDKLM